MKSFFTNVSHETPQPTETENRKQKTMSITQQELKAMWEDMDYDTRRSLMGGDYIEPTFMETLYLEFDSNADIILKNDLGKAVLPKQFEIRRDNDDQTAIFIDGVKTYEVLLKTPEKTSLPEAYLSFNKTLIPRVYDCDMERIYYSNDHDSLWLETLEDGLTYIYKKTPEGAIEKTHIVVL